MRFGLTNVNKYLTGEQRSNPAIAGDFSMLISDVVRSCKAISQTVSLGKLTLRKEDGGDHRSTGWHYQPPEGNGQPDIPPPLRMGRASGGDFFGGDGHHLYPAVQRPKG